ncbi:MAG: hypothetical protein HYX27_07950 [Acidobacteria bacterium]|nr:hypothetical protein [Acidobacteriota bacterium]
MSILRFTKRTVLRQCLFVLIAAGSVFPQSTPELEKRIADLEQQMRKLDPSFQSAGDNASLAARLEVLERKMAILTGAPKPVIQATAPPAPPVQPPPLTAGLAPSAPGSPLSGVSITGDYQKADNGETKLPVSGYMDFHFNKNRSLPGEFDFHRFVLLFGHSFSERIKFWSELELEHSIVEGGEEKGEVALEQAYVDFLIKPYFNLRGGMVLSPVGIVNERHEPPSFNGVERPFVETLIIPTTWREMGFGATGDFGRGFRYRAYMVSGLDGSLFNAEHGISEAKTNGFLASFRNPAKVGRLEYAGRRKLVLGTSFYSGHAGFNLATVNPRVNIFDADVRYSYRRADVRGLFAKTWISKARELNIALERTTGANPNVGRELLGAYVEPAFHVFPKRRGQDVILFGRYEKYNTQHRMPDGFTALPQFNRSSWVLGATYKPVADVAIKFDYNFNRSASKVLRPLDSINLGIGWWF